MLNTRRQALETMACGFGSLALNAMLGTGGRAASGSIATSPGFVGPMHRPAAKRVIFLGAVLANASVLLVNTSI